ncbi:hypothetical protein AZA_84602 [Nitrospirillum viridazoti Y2]|nr:hypothetical protein AZA_84602 [Nitrospirillum amazonense Y2]
MGGEDAQPGQETKQANPNNCCQREDQLEKRPIERISQERRARFSENTSMPMAPSHQKRDPFIRPLGTSDASHPIDDKSDGHEIAGQKVPHDESKSSWTPMINR